MSTKTQDYESLFPNQRMETEVNLLSHDCYFISHTLSEKLKCAKPVPLWVQPLVSGTVPSKGCVCNIFGALK